MAGMSRHLYQMPIAHHIAGQLDFNTRRLLRLSILTKSLSKEKEKNIKIRGTVLFEKVG